MRVVYTAVPIPVIPFTTLENSTVLVVASLLQACPTTLMTFVTQDHACNGKR